MSEFTTALPVRAGLDPLKHVNFAIGMVLGKDDLDQEFAYLSGHDRWLARDTLGYGTLSGLAVTVGTAADGGPEVRVAAGTALTPAGQLVRVPVAQCARLDPWLAADAQRDAVGSSLAASPPAPLSAYVVLCYAECPSDEVLIPGEPCRSEDDLRAPSRITDDFRLELRLAPPAQDEEDAVRAFIHRLRAAVVVVEDEPASGDLDDFLALVRGLDGAETSPPAAARAELSPMRVPLPIVRPLVGIVTRTDVTRSVQPLLVVPTRAEPAQGLASSDTPSGPTVTTARPIAASPFAGSPLGRPRLDGSPPDGSPPDASPPERSPPEASPPEASPPASPPEDLRFRMPAALACAWMGNALRLWITEIRPRYRAEFLQGAGCGDGVIGAGPEACLLLAELQVPLAAGGRAIPAGIAIVEDRRPLLGALRFWQEWVLCGPTVRGARGLPGADGADGAPGAAGRDGRPGGDGQDGAGIAGVAARALPPGTPPTATLDRRTRIVTLGIPSGKPGDAGSIGEGFVESPREGDEEGKPVPFRILAAGRVRFGNGAANSCNGLRLTGFGRGFVFVTWDTAERDIKEQDAGGTVIVPKVLPSLPDKAQSPLEFGRLLVANLDGFSIDPESGDPGMRLAVLFASGEIPSDNDLPAMEFSIELSRFRRDDR